jgi:hypothetical protein
MTKKTIMSMRTIQRDKHDPKIIYDPNRTLAASLATSYGEVIIGVKDNPTKAELAETIKHEKSHLGHRTSIDTTMLGGSRDYLVMAREELRAYRKERKVDSPAEWNKDLPIRIKSFMAYLSWVTKADQRKIKVQAKRVLAPKRGGNNEKAVCQAKADLARWWLEEEKAPTECGVIVVRRSINDIEKELQRMTKGAHGPEERIKPGVGYTSRRLVSHGVYADTKNQRITRRRHRGWKRIRYT